MSFPKPDAPSRAYFESVLPEDPRVQARPMFSNLAGFVNGNMFIGLFGSAVFVRLSEEDRAELLKEDGAAIFEPCLSGCNPHPLYVGCAVIRQARVSEWKLMF